MNREDLGEMLDRFMECSGPMAYDVEIDVVGFWNGVIDSLIEKVNGQDFDNQPDAWWLDDWICRWLKDQKIEEDDE